MALQKDITLDNGFTANYWRVERYDVSREGTGLVRIFLTGWKDQTAFTDGLARVEKVINVMADNAESDITNDLVNITWCYTKAKELPEFDGAVDVLPN